MPVWLGETPGATGRYRYMHEDGRVEDVDPASVGMPPGWVPPGFETDPAQTSFATDTQAAPPDAVAAQPQLPEPAAPFAPPGLNVEPLQAPQVEAPVQTAPTAPAPGSSSSTSTSSSWRGATAPIEGYTGASDGLSRRAAAEARGAIGMYAPALNAQADAIQGIAEQQALSSEAQAQGFELEAAALRDQQEGRMREVAEIDQRSQRWTAELREAIDSVPTLDSKRLFKNQNNLEHASTAIAAFMGGFLQPVLGTNTPMDIINKAIDRDIAEQQGNAEQAQRKVWNLKDLASRDMDAATWELNQSDVARLGHITALQRDVQAKVQGYQSDVFRKQGEKLLGDLEKQRIDTYQNIYVTTRGFMEQQRHSMRMESIQSQARKDAAAARQAEIDARAGGKGEDLTDREIRDPATGKVVAHLRGGTVAQVSEYNAKQAGAYEASRNLLRFKQLTAKVGDLWKKGNFGSTPEAQELRAVYSDILSDTIRAKTGAAATEAEIARLERIIPLGTKFNPSVVRTIEAYVNKTVDGQNTLNTTSLTPLPGEQTLSYNFNDSVDKLRAEHTNTEAPGTERSMSNLTLELQAARTPAEAQTAVRKIVDIAEADAQTDYGRAGVQRAIEMLKQLPPEVRSLPSTDGDIDPVSRLETILYVGKSIEGGKALNKAERDANGVATQDDPDYGRAGF